MIASRFYPLWQRNVSAGGSWSADRLYQHLLQLYGEGHRHYHNADHIDLCLEWFDRYRSTVEDPDAVELAIWFHDACYGPEPVGHESSSAQLFREVSADGMPKARQDKVCGLIMDTTHQSPPVSDEGALLVDIDLASFARSWHPYLKDTARCRAEQGHMEENELCRCQVAFLSSLLARQHIYYSTVFRENHEQQARNNIETLLHLLEHRLNG